MQKWLLFAVCMFISIGPASIAGARSNLETAKEFVAAVENLPTVKEVDAFLSKYLDKDVAEQVKKSDINKFAFRISKPGESGTWWIIFEHKTRPIACAYLCKGDPPEDAKILETRRGL